MSDRQIAPGLHASETLLALAEKDRMLHSMLVERVRAQWARVFRAAPMNDQHTHEQRDG